MTHLYVEYGVDILVYICVCSHIHVYIRNVYTYAIYTQPHPYTHTPSPIPFHAHQPTPARHLITSNPTRVPYDCMRITPRIDKPIADITNLITQDLDSCNQKSIDV